MNAAEDSFWSTIETAPGFAAVPAFWQTALGPDHETRRSAFFQRRPALARCYPCLRCGCEHEVVATGPDAFCAVCLCESWNCPDLSLTTADLELWEVSLGKVARAVGAAFGLRQRFCELGIPGVVQAGVWSADSVPVILAVHGGREQFRHAVALLCARLPRRFILFAPTAAHIDASTAEMLERERSAFFALERCASLTRASTLVPVTPPGELFSAFRPAETRTLDEDAARSAFELVRRLDVSERLKPPTLLTVFRLYCIEQLSAARIARLSGCAKSTVLERLKLLRRKTGADPARLRPLSPHLARVEDALSDSRAKHLHRRTAAYGDEEDSDA
jgi:hypothetical protein